MFPVFFQCRNAMVDISKVILNKVDLQAIYIYKIYVPVNIQANG